MLGTLRARLNALQFAQLLVIFSFVGILQACAMFRAPLDLAETLEQKYAAIKLTYDATLTPVVQVIQDPTAPEGLRRTLQTAVADSAIMFESVNIGYQQWTLAKSQIAAGDSTPERIQIAADNLDTWIAQLELHLGQMKRLVDSRL